MCSFRDALKRKLSPIGKENIRILIENAEYAKKNSSLAVYDTGTCVVIMETARGHQGRTAAQGAGESGRPRGYKNGYLRNSMVADPLERINTNDNTPAVVHTEMVDGDQVTITVLPKSDGSENSQGTPRRYCTGRQGRWHQGVRARNRRARRRQSCPHYIIGIGVGGTMDHCSWMAKKSLLRPIGMRNAKPLYAKLEGGSPGGRQQHRHRSVGHGRASDRAGCPCRFLPCHITALPSAINFQCNASQHAEPSETGGSEPWNDIAADQGEKVKALKVGVLSHK